MKPGKHACRKYPPERDDEVFEKVMEQAENFKKWSPDLDTEPRESTGLKRSYPEHIARYGSAQAAESE